MGFIADIGNKNVKNPKWKTALRLFAGPPGALSEAQEYQDKQRAMIDELPTDTPRIDLTGEDAYRDWAGKLSGRRYKMPKYTTAKKASKYVKGMEKHLGIDSPKSTAQAQRKAIMGALDRGAHERSVADTARMAQTGMNDSGLAFALASRGRGDLSQQRAEAEAGIQERDAARMDAYRRELMGAAQGAASALNQNAMARKQFLDQQRRAEVGNLMAQAGMERGQAMKEWEVNQLMPFQAEQAKYLAQAEMLGKKSGQLYADEQNRRNILGKVFGKGMMGGGEAQQPQQQGGYQMPQYGYQGSLQSNYGQGSNYTGQYQQTNPWGQ